MEKLKVVLKRALGDGATQVNLRTGEKATMLLKYQSIALPEFGKIEQSWIEGLYKTLFPRDGLAILSQQVLRSHFSIVNVGKVHVVADPRPPKSLYLFFPPNGEFLSQDYVVSLTSTSTIQAPPPPPPPPQASQAQTKTVQAPPSAPSESDAATTQVYKTSTVQAQATKPTSATKPTMATQTRTQFSSTSASLPDEIFENKNKLGLIFTNNTSIVPQIKIVFSSMQVHPFSSEDAEQCMNIIERVTPSLVFIDDSHPKFSQVFKMLYDLDISRRSLMTLLMLSKTYKSRDSKSAFVTSVDGIVNVENLHELESIADKAHKERTEIFRIWLDLASKI